MHKSTSPKRKSFKLYAIASTVLVTSGSVAALVAGVTPATAANLATQPDTQIAVFMVPLTILVLAIMFEVTRFALAWPPPGRSTASPASPSPLGPPGRGEG
jgi:hypothetical protein